MNGLGRVALAERTPQRDYMREYMRHYRLGRRLRVRKPPMPRFNRPGHCSNCCHAWPAEGRCPLCALESAPGRAVGYHRLARRWIAWSQLMEVLAA